MRHAMQNIVFGVEFHRKNLTDDQFDLLNDDDNISNYYNGNSRYAGFSYIGSEINTLQDDRLFDLENFINSFNREDFLEKYKEVVTKLKESDILKNPEFENFDFDEFITSLGEPRLVIIPETD